MRFNYAFSKNDWNNHNRADDYSLNSTAITYADWIKAAAYVDITLELGVEA